MLFKIIVVIFSNFCWIDFCDKYFGLLILVGFLCLVRVKDFIDVGSILKSGCGVDVEMRFFFRFYIKIWRYVWFWF